MKRFLLAMLCALFLFGCISQPIRPATPNVPSQYVQDVGPSASAVDKMQSKNYWQSASPFSIIAWKYSDSTIELSLQNRDGAEVTLTGVFLDGSRVSSNRITFSPDQMLTVTALMPKSCGSRGEGFSIEEVRLVYEKSGVSGLEQKGLKPLVGTCS